MLKTTESEFQYPEIIAKSSKIVVCYKCNHIFLLKLA